jgi:bacterioferritin-associated ferredoxin
MARIQAHRITGGRWAGAPCDGSHLKLNSIFNMLLPAMAALPMPTAETLPATAPPRECLRPAVSRPMTRCECSGTSFEEVARQLYVEGRALPDILRRTGCGQNCGACLSDLYRHLAARG